MGAIYVGRPRLAILLAPSIERHEKREARREKKQRGPGFARRSTLIIVPPTYDRG